MTKKRRNYKFEERRFYPPIERACTKQGLLAIKAIFEQVKAEREKKS